MSVVDFKRRLGILISITAPSQVGFAEAMKNHGRKTHNSTVSRWIDQSSPMVPNTKDLIALAEVEPRVSIDYLIGRRPAETVTEKFIEERVK